MTPHGPSSCASSSWAGRWCAFRALVGGRPFRSARILDLKTLLSSTPSMLRVMAGAGTIGLEILEDLPDVDAVVLPFGGGGLASGVATALRALKPATRVYAVEVATAAPLAAAFAAGAPREVAFSASFVDGIGSTSVFPRMWTLAQQLLDGALVASVAHAAAAIRLVAERQRVIAEGAGGCAVAAALDGQAGSGKVVCVISGGNLGLDSFAGILTC